LYSRVAVLIASPLNLWQYWIVKSASFTLDLFPSIQLQVVVHPSDFVVEFSVLYTLVVCDILHTDPGDAADSLLHYHILRILTLSVAVEEG
jgi:hypothetical protein